MPIPFASQFLIVLASYLDFLLHPSTHLTHFYYDTINWSSVVSDPYEIDNKDDDKDGEFDGTDAGNGIGNSLLKEGNSSTESANVQICSY